MNDLWDDQVKTKEKIQDYLVRSETIMRQVVDTKTPHRLTHRFQVDPSFFNGYQGYCLTNNMFGPLPTKETLIACLKRDRKGFVNPRIWPIGCTQVLPVAQWLSEIYREQGTSSWSFFFAPCSSKCR